MERGDIVFIQGQWKAELLEIFPDGYKVLPLEGRPTWDNGPKIFQKSLIEATKKTSHK